MKMKPEDPTSAKLDSKEPALIFWTGRLSRLLHGVEPDMEPRKRLWSKLITRCKEDPYPDLSWYVVLSTPRSIRNQNLLSKSVPA